MKMESSLKEIKTCDDCIHCKACVFAYLEAFGKFDKTAYGNAACDEFQDKSRFIELPCAVGDTVWVFNYHNGNVYENRVDGIYITGASGWNTTVRPEYKNGRGEVQYRKFAWKQIGKTVFLTREEAEKALAKIGANDG